VSKVEVVFDAASHGGNRILSWRSSHWGQLESCERLPLVLHRCLRGQLAAHFPFLVSV